MNSQHGVLMWVLFSERDIFKEREMAALSRLFGKSKREVASPSSPTDHLETTDRDDTVFVTNTNTNTPPQPRVEHLPYQLPGRQSQLPSGLQQMNINKQDAGAGWQPLAGVQFSLHSR